MLLALLFQFYSNFFYSSSSSTSSTSSSDEDETLVATVHGVEWRNTGPVVEELNHISSSIDGTHIPIAGPARLLSAQTEFTSDSRALDAFLLVFPPNLILSILSATNANPAFSGTQPLTKDELFHFLGCMFAFTLFPNKFGDRRSFWQEPLSKGRSTLFQSPNLGRYISRGRFELILSSLRLHEYDQESSDPWTPVRYLFQEFNNHRPKIISPGRFLCVDESVSECLECARWTLFLPLSISPLTQL